MKTIILLGVATVAGSAVYLGGGGFPDRTPALPPCCVAPPAVTAVAAEKPAVDDRPVSPRSIYQLDARWTDDSGGRRTLASLRGTPVVMAMIFTHCDMACPMMVADLMGVQAALPEEARRQTRFLLVSFDDQRDTPEALHAYRSRMGLDDTWTLLRGEADEVQELAMLLGVKYARDSRGNFSHSNHITVLDRGGEIAFQREGLRGGSAAVVHAVDAALTR